MRLLAWIFVLIIFSLHLPYTESGRRPGRRPFRNWRTIPDPCPWRLSVENWSPRPGRASQVFQTWMSSLRSGNRARYASPLGTKLRSLLRSDNRLTRARGRRRTYSRCLIGTEFPSWAVVTPPYAPGLTRHQYDYYDHLVNFDDQYEYHEVEDGCHDHIKYDDSYDYELGHEHHHEYFEHYED